MWSSPREGEEEEEEEEEGEGHFRRGHVGRSVGVYKPAQFVGSISNILKKFPEGLQIQRVGVLGAYTLVPREMEAAQSIPNNQTYTTQTLHAYRLQTWSICASA